MLLMALVFAYWYSSNRGSNTNQIESIAVMPLVNESGNPDLDYLSDGMTERLIGSLSQLPKIRVKARSSVFRYKGKEADASTIGKELTIQAILTGRIVQRGRHRKNDSNPSSSIPSATPLKIIRNSRNEGATVVGDSNSSPKPCTISPYDRSSKLIAR